MRRDLLLEKCVLVLSIFESILFECFIADHGIIGTDSRWVNP